MKSALRLLLYFHLSCSRLDHRNDFQLSLFDHKDLLINPLKISLFQIENKTLSPEEVQVGTVLSMEDHKNSISQLDRYKESARDQGTRDQGKGLTRSRAGYRERERTDSLRSRTETLVSQSVVENTLKIQR